MASDLQIQGEVVVNSEKAESAFDRVGDKAQQMANEVATSAGKAGQAVDKIGDGAGASAEKFTRAESRMSAAIKKATNELELLGKTASQRLEFNIADKGLDASKFEPALKKLREVEAQAQAAQRAATGSLDKMGISAAQTAAALRGVPAQFTDIVTSLQGGQQPLTVLLQQGGQLKDMFGGVGAAARALGGYVLGLVNPFTVLAAAAGGVAFAYSQGSKEADAYRMALITTGNAAGTTAGQLQAYARDISGVVGTQGKAAESLAAMAGTGKVVGDMLRESAQAAVMWERATGQAVGKTAEQFASFAGAPLQAVLKMNDSMNFLTLSTYKQIKAMEDEGRTTEAAAAAQRAYADALSGRAGEIERNLGSIERGWNRIKDAAKAGWDAILNVGRQNTTQDQLSDTRKRIAQLESQLGGGFGDTGGGAATGRPNGAAQARIQAELAGLKAQEAALQGVAYASKVAAEEEAARAAQVKAAADWDKEGLKYLSDRAKMERELVKARNEGAAAGASQAEIEQRLAAIRESYAKKGSSSHAEENKELREQRRILSELAGVSSTYYADLAAFQSQRAKGLVTEAQYVAAVESLIKKQPFAVELAKQQAEATKLQLQTLEAERVARVAIAQEAEKGAASLVQSNAAMAAEIELIGLSKQEQTAILRQRNDAIILTKQATLAEIERRDAITGTMTREQIALAAEIEALKKRNELLGDKSLREDIAERDKQLSDELARNIQSYDDIFRRGFADMLNRGEDGIKAFGKSLKTTVMTSIADAIYRALAQKFVVNIVGNILGVSGTVGQAAQMATGGNGLMGMASNASSMYQLYTGQGMLGNAASTVGGWLGLGGTAATGLGLTAAAGAGTTLAATSTGLGLAGSAAGAGYGLTAAGTGLGISAGSAGAGAIGAGLGTSAAAGGAGAAAGSAGVGSALAAIPGWGWAAAGAAAILGNILGRKTEKRGAGLMGTLGEDGGVHDLDLMRKGGSLFSGPKWFVRDMGTSAMDKGLQDAFKAQSDAARKMAESLGLATDGVKDFTAVLGTDTLGDNKVKGLRLDGLSDQEVQAKIAEALATANNELAQRLIGTWEDVTTQVANRWLNPEGETTTTTSVYKPSEFARDGERAIDTLTRLSTSLTGVNQTFEALGATLYEASLAGGDMASQLVDLFGGADKFQAATGGYLQNYYSAEEQRAAVQRQLQKAFDGLDLKMPDIDASDARAQFRALAEAQDLTTDAGRKAYAALLQLSGAFAGVTQEVQDTAALLEAQAAALKKQRDDAYSALDRAVSAEKKLLQDQLSAARDVEKSIGSIFTLLHDNVLSLYGTVDGTRAMQAQQGQTFIADALATAKASGYLPDADQLKEAISAVRGELDNSTDNRAERDYAALVLAGQLSGMEDIAGKQLTDAKRTIQVLEGQSKQLDKTLDYWRQQIDIASGTYDATLSVSDAVNRLSALLGGGGKPGSSTPGGGGSSGYTAGGGVSQRVGYGADEALTSFDKFKAWYDGLRHNVDPKMLMGSGYQVPDWMRVMHMAGDSTDKELFGAYLNMKNNPETAKDYERIMTTGRSGMVTDGSTLVRSDLSSMPKEIREYFEKDRNSLLSYEAMGIDPVLGYKLYKDGAGQFGIDKNTNLTSWLQQHKWTEGGVVSNNNAMDTLNNWKGYNLARWDLATGTVVDLDGKIYTADGQLIGSAGNGLMQQVYGSAFVGASGKDYGDATRSALYASQVTGGATQADYYANIKTGLDQAIASGKSAQDIADAIRSTGASMSDVAGAYGITVQQLEDNLRAGGANNIPKFAVGTNYVPRDMLAQIHEGEAIVPKAYNPWAGGGTSSNERLEALIERLTAEVAELRAAADATAANTGKSAAVLVSVQSGNSLTTAPVPVF